MGRVYDKHRESKDEAYAKCWRYEVEAKGDGAEATRSFVNSIEADSGSIASFVEGWFRNRGVDVRFRSGLAPALEAIGAEPSDDIRTLRWLRSGVAPALDRLGERYTRAALIRWLFDGATMESMHGDAREVEQIRLRAVSRELLRSTDRVIVEPSP